MKTFTAVATTFISTFSLFICAIFQNKIPNATKFVVTTLGSMLLREANVERFGNAKMPWAINDVISWRKTPTYFETFHVEFTLSILQFVAL